MIDITIARTYQIKKKLGAGAFGEIFLATNLKTKGDFAVKCEAVNTKHPQLFYEAKLINYLNNEETLDKGIPHTYFCCTEGEHNILVMDLLGPSLEELFNQCNKRFDLKTSCQLAIQMIDRIEFVQKKQFIHRDIKPDNFLMGGEKRSHKLYLIDFGLAKKYVQKDNSHIIYRDNKNLTGTARYASLNTHLGVEQGRRDDIEGIANVLLYFVKGYLPWQNLKANNKKEKYEKIMEKKLSTPLEILCKDIPDEFKMLLTYSRDLEFEDEPDYEKMKGWFSNLMKREAYEMDYTYTWDIPDMIVNN